MTSPTKAAELAEKLDEAGLSMWQAYCDKKAEVEELREQMQQVAEQILRNDREGVVAWASGVHLSMEEDGSTLLRASEGRVPETWRDAVAGLVDDVDGLIGESAGVYGLHLNGDPSPWDELVEGGRFERLTHLEQVRALLTAAPHPPAQQASCWRALDGHGIPQTDWIDGDPGDTQSAWIGGRIEKAYTSPPPHKAEGTEQ